LHIEFTFPARIGWEVDASQVVLEETRMKQNRIIGTALLFLLLGVPAFAEAKKGPKEKGGGGQKAQQVQQRGNNGFHGQGNNGNHYGRITDNHFRANFGRGHAFRMGSPRLVNGSYRFRYSGYLFGYSEPWPSGWNYNDNVYVDYVGGAYYMYNPRHPGIHITLNLF
jgi:hypothetical protein